MLSKAKLRVQELSEVFWVKLGSVGKCWNSGEGAV